MSSTDVNLTKLVQSKSSGKGLEVKMLPALSVKSIDVNTRQITAVASTGTIDRHGEIVLPEAFKETLPRYMKNPVVLAAHCHYLDDGHSPVVGRVVNATIDKKGLHVVIKFAETELGQEYWVLYSTKMQRAFSVSFYFGDSRIERIGDRKVRVHTRVELIEISCVAVPANPDALSRSAKNKIAFVNEKKEQQEYDRIVKELRSQNPNLDAEADEFAKALLSGEPDGAKSDPFSSANPEFVAKLKKELLQQGLDEYWVENLREMLIRDGYEIRGCKLVKVGGGKVKASDILAEHKTGESESESESEIDLVSLVQG